MRFSSKLFALLALTVLSLTPRASSAQQESFNFNVTLPNATGTSGETATLPVTVDDLTGEDVFSYEFTISYDASVINVTGVSTSGTLSDGLNVQPNTEEPGQITVTAAATSALSGAGTLLNLEAEYAEAGTSPLTWQSFTYNESQSPATTTDGTVTVEAGSNQPPSASDDSAATNVETPVRIDVLANDSDTDGALDPSSLAIGSGPSNGSAGVADSGRAVITYAPETSFTGTDSFTYTVADDAGATSDPATVTVTVEDAGGGDEGLTARLPDTSGTAGETATLPVTVDDLTGEDVFSYEFTISYDASVINVTGVSTSGTLSDGLNVQPNTEEPGQITVTAAATSALSGAGTLLNLDVAYVGVGTSPLTWQSFTFNEGTPTPDEQGGSVAVESSSDNQPPVAVGDQVETKTEVTVRIDALANDNDPDGTLDTSTVAIETPPESGLIQIRPSGVIAYTPEADFTGTDSFTYTVADEAGASSQAALVSITVNALPNPDSLALVALYNSTGGDNWTNNSGWLTDAPLSAWAGVTLTGDRVTGLDLGNNNLTGEIPSQLARMSRLKNLNLASNQLGGEIPARLGQLAELQTLALNGNQLSGRIPTTLTGLSRLDELAVDNTGVCESDDASFQAWLDGVGNVRSTGEPCTTSGSYDVKAGQTGTIGLSGSGASIRVTENEDTGNGGSISFSRDDNPPQNSTFSQEEATTPSGVAVSPTATVNRSWTFSAEDFESDDLGFRVRLDTSDLKGIKDVDQLVILKREDENEEWRALNTSREYNVLVSEKLSSFSEFTVGGDAADNPVPTDDQPAPTEFALRGNAPNPVRQATTIRYALPRSGRVTLTVYDVLGRRVATLLGDEKQAAGRKRVRFDASGLAAGVYLYRLTAGSYAETRRMVVVR
jgi:hypothetical protein